VDGAATMVILFKSPCQALIRVTLMLDCYRSITVKYHLVMSSIVMTASSPYHKNDLEATFVIVFCS